MPINNKPFFKGFFSKKEEAKEKRALTQIENKRALKVIDDDLQRDELKEGRGGRGSNPQLPA